MLDPYSNLVTSLVRFDTRPNGELIDEGGEIPVNLAGDFYTAPDDLFCGGSQAGVFDGYMDYFQYSSYPFTPTNSFTIESYFVAEANTYAHSIFGTGGTSGANSRSAVGIQSDGAIYWEVGSGTVHRTAAAVLVFGELHHIAFVFDSSAKTIKLFLDGTEIMVLSNQTNGWPNSNYPFLVGAGYSSSYIQYGRYFKGRMYAFRVTSDHRYTNDFNLTDTYFCEEIVAGAYSTVSGIVQIDGSPAERTVRAFGYSETVHELDGEPVTLSKSLGHATSDPETGDYTIDLLAGYGQEIFVVAFDDYGAPFTPEANLAAGNRIHPTTPNGHVWETTGAGTLPTDEPTWVVDTETSQLYGTASMIARPFYRPMVHGPIMPEVTTPDPAP